jgi:hypothetical protein
MPHSIGGVVLVRVTSLLVPHTLQLDFSTYLLTRSFRMLHPPCPSHVPLMSLILSVSHPWPYPLRAAQDLRALPTTTPKTSPKLDLWPYLRPYLTSASPIAPLVISTWPSSSLSPRLALARWRGCRRRRMQARLGEDVCMSRGNEEEGPPGGRVSSNSRP